MEHLRYPCRVVGSVVLAALMLTTVVACSSDDDTSASEGTGGSSSSSAALEKIRIVPWGGRIVDFIDFYVGEEQGFFEEAGIEIEQLPAQGAGDAVRNVVAGNADIAMADPFSGFFAVIAGSPLEGFYCPYTKNWLTLVVNTSAGIEEPADLAGKKIAVTSQASTSRYLATLFLADHGVDPDDVEMVATGVEFGSALLSNQAHAASTWESINWALFDNGGIPADQADDYEVWEYEQFPGPNDVYFSDPSWVEENEELVGRFVDAIEKAKLWIAENVDEAVRIAAEYAEGADDMERNRAVIDLRVGMQSEGPGVAENGMGWCDVETIQGLADTGQELGILEGAVDASALISNRFLEG